MVGRLLRRCSSCITVSCWTSTVLSAARKWIYSMTLKLDFETSRPTGTAQTNTQKHTTHEDTGINTKAEWDQMVLGVRWLDKGRYNNAQIHISHPPKSHPLIHSWHQTLHPHQRVSLSCCYSNRIPIWWGGWLQVLVSLCVRCNTMQQQRTQFVKNHMADQWVFVPIVTGSESTSQLSVISCI